MIKLEKVKASETRKIHMNIFPQRIPKGDVPPPQTLEEEGDATAEWFAMNVKSVYVLGVFIRVLLRGFLITGRKVKRITKYVK